MIQTIQQERARYALECVNRDLETDVDHKEYKARAKSFPAMIRTNGLGPAAAFYLSKSAERGDPHGCLYRILSDWLTDKHGPYRGQPDLMTGITKSDIHGYRAAQAEAFLLLEWVAKFADAFAGAELEATP